jgi:hypothetical protein
MLTMLFDVGQAFSVPIVDEKGLLATRRKTAGLRAKCNQQPRV